MCKFFFSCWLKKFQELFTPLTEFQEHVAKSEAQYKEIKRDIEKLKKSIDPLTELIISMENDFQIRKKQSNHVESR